MTMKLFVGGLSFDTDTDGLRREFERFGNVDDAVVILDRETGRSRGFGFVSFAQRSDAETAQVAMDGAQLDGRQLRVSEAAGRSGPSDGGARRHSSDQRPNRW